MTSKQKDQQDQNERQFTVFMQRLLRVKKEEIQALYKQPGKGRSGGKDSQTPERKRPL